MRRSLLNMKRRVALSMAVVMAATLLPAASPKPYRAKAAETELSNPVIVEDDFTGERTVAWDSVYFGSYPQAEVIPGGVEYTALDSSLRREGDVIVSDSVYSALQNASGWDENNDITLDGAKYRRMKEEDATYVESFSSSGYYQWGGDTDYHYFKYEPIKWRVLHTDRNQVLLLSDVALDDQKYHTKDEGVTWETSTVRSWLNGYGAGSNKQSVDYSQKNFIGSAFTASEQAAIVNSSLDNADNITNGTSGGNNTTDKIFLLSESDVWNTDKAKSYGFVKGGYSDESRFCKGSTYAKAMGMWGNTDVDYAGNGAWWLRSPGKGSNFAMHVDYDGWVYYDGSRVINYRDGLRPALNLNLSSPNLYTYAGKVYSQEKQVEEITGSIDDVGVHTVLAEYDKETWYTFSPRKTGFYLVEYEDGEWPWRLDVYQDEWLPAPCSGYRGLYELEQGHTYYLGVWGDGENNERSVKVLGIEVPKVSIDAPVSERFFTFTVPEDGYYTVNREQDSFGIYRKSDYEEIFYTEGIERGSYAAWRFWLEKDTEYFVALTGETETPTRIAKTNRYEYYEYEQCQSFLASGGSINYVPDETGKGGSWEFNTDGFKNPEDTWTPAEHLHYHYEPEGVPYQFAYDAFKQAEDMYRPLEQLYIAKPGNIFSPVAPTDLTTGGDALMVAKFKETGETPTPPGQPDKKPSQDTDKKPPETPVAVKPSGIRINYTKIKMQKGTKFKWLEASVLPQNASDQTLTWESSNPKVASVDGKGVIKAKKAGKARITVSTVNGIKKDINVQVVNKKITVAKITLSQKKAIVKKGRKLKLRAAIAPVNAANKKLTWKSSNPKVASVNSKGVVTAKKPGKVKITCTAKDKSRKKAVCVVSVKKK